MSMRKFKVGMAAILILGIVALFFVVPALSQGPALPPGEYDLEAGQYVFNVPELVETPAPTDTPVLPTDTPVPSGHSKVDNHPVSADIGHTHNEQDLLEHIFGPPGAWHNGNSISYPWQTWQGLDADPLGPSSGVMENDIKHEGYKWSAVEFSVCENNFFHDLGENCVMAYRLLHHAVGAPVGANHRLHSFSLEMKICTPDLSQCGILRTGGHADYGRLLIAPIGGGFHQSIYVPLPNDPPEFATQGGPASKPYRHHERPENVPSSSGRVPYDWHTGIAYGWNQTAVFAFRTIDDWQAINPDNPSEVAPLGLPHLNHSTVQIYVLRFNTYPNAGDWDYLDENGDGTIDFSGFTDRQGNIVGNCSLGPDCIPFILEGVPVGPAVYYPAQNGPWTEYDLAPEDESWIEFPN